MATQLTQLLLLWLLCLKGPAAYILIMNVTYIAWFCFETRALCVAQAGLEIAMLSQLAWASQSSSLGCLATGFTYHHIQLTYFHLKIHLYQIFPCIKK